MKRLLIALLIALGLAGIGAPDVLWAQAQTASPGSSLSSESTSQSSESASSGDRRGRSDSAAGAYAAVGCGLFGRALGSGLVSVGTIAGAIACCAFIFIDAAFF